tara:strand:- start:814 stop:951 length:138 start_codon:yes stop_codon:yes gene_type:complete
MASGKIEAEPKGLHRGVYYGDRRDQQILDRKGAIDEVRVGANIIS